MKSCVYVYVRVSMYVCVHIHALMCMRVCTSITVIICNRFSDCACVCMRASVHMRVHVCV